MQGEREALLIATGSYADVRLSRLRSPARDVRELAEVLADDTVGGFHVDRLVDPRAQEMRQSIERFFKNRGRNDLLLVHLSCHGIKDDDGNLYFAAHDTEKDLPDSTGVSAEFLRKHMAKCRARSIVILLDCCYSGVFIEGRKGDDDVHLKDELAGHGRAVLTATNSTEYAWEGDHASALDPQPSRFTAAVVAGLHDGQADLDGDGRVSVDDLYTYVYERLKRERVRQTPKKWAELEYKVFLTVRRPAPRITWPVSGGFRPWRAPLPVTGTAAPAVGEGWVAMTGTDGVLKVFDAETGREVKRWQHATAGPTVVDGWLLAGFQPELGDPGDLFMFLRPGMEPIPLCGPLRGQPTTEPSTGSGFFAVGTTAGLEVLRLLSPSAGARSRERLATSPEVIPTDRPLLARPAVTGDRIYAAGHDCHLRAYSTATRSHRWSYKTRKWLDTTPAIGLGVLYVGGYDRRLHALTMGEGELLWRYSAGGPIKSSPAVSLDLDIVCFGSHDGSVHALRASTGEPVWRHRTEGVVKSSPVIVGDTVYIGGRDRRLRALDAQTGEPRWVYATQGRIDTAPAVANGVVYVASEDGSIHAVDATTGQGPLDER